MSSNNKMDSRKQNKNNRSKYTRNNKRNEKYDSKKTKNYDVQNASETNDISWYTSNAQLVRDAARVPFGNQLGRALTGIRGDGFRSVPGVCAIEVVPGPGIAESVTDAVNIAATNLFQYIRKNLSTYAGYAAADVMMYVMAVDELYAWYNYVARLFGIANNYSAVNLYYPHALLRANGMSDDDIVAFRENMNDARAKFNSLIYKAASIYMPVDISIVKRHMWLFGNYFADANSAKAQIYMYVPAGWHVLDETTNDNGTMLKFKTKQSRESFGIWEALDVFDQMIESIRNSDSMLKIAADMRRAYENSQPWTLAYIPEGFTILPIVDHNVLHQIMNSVIHPYGVWVQDGVFDVTQSVEHNKIIYKPTVEVSNDSDSKYSSFANFAEADGLIINFFKPEVTSDDLVEATRNISLFKYDDGVMTFYTSGADICVGARIWIRNPAATGEFQYDHYDFDTYPVYLASSSATTGHTVEWAAIPNLVRIHAFDWAPNIYVRQSLNTNNPYPFIAFDNYTQIASENVRMLNEAVLTSMWQVPDFRLPTAAEPNRR